MYLRIASEVVFVADDVFVLIALPNGNARRAPVVVDAFGDGGFE
jgi:hypothetical protein